MRVRILGCGASSGVPVLGCRCDVCRSPDRRNWRTRPSILVEDGETRLLVDASPDLRAQLLEASITRLDAVIFTHAHADHTHGLDELRSINFHTDSALDVYGDGPTLATLRERFGYAFAPRIPGRGWYKPVLKARSIDGAFGIGTVAVTPFRQGHGEESSLGFRFADVAYSTDADRLDDDAFAALEGVGLWIVDCLKPEPSLAHAHLARTLEWIDRLRPARAVLTHLSHGFEYHALAAMLPPGVEPAYDGMTIDWP